MTNKTFSGTRKHREST